MEIVIVRQNIKNKMIIFYNQIVRFFDRSYFWLYLFTDSSMLGMSFVLPEAD